MRERVETASESVGWGCPRSRGARVTHPTRPLSHPRPHPIPPRRLSYDISCAPVGPFDSDIGTISEVVTAGSGRDPRRALRTCVLPHT